VDERLRATDYQVGDPVIGEADGETFTVERRHLQVV
jgi:hypothetical protein